MNKIFRYMCVLIFTSLFSTGLVMSMNVKINNTTIFVPNYHKWNHFFSYFQQSIKDPTMQKKIGPIQTFYDAFKKNIKLFDSIFSFLKSKKTSDIFSFFNFVPKVETIALVEINDRVLYDLVWHIASFKDKETAQRSLWQRFIHHYHKDELFDALKYINNLLNNFALDGEINIVVPERFKSYEDAKDYATVLNIKAEYSRKKEFIKALKTIFNNLVLSWDDTRIQQARQGFFYMLKKFLLYSSKKDSEKKVEQSAREKALAEAMNKPCAICTEVMNKKKPLEALKCNHVFHEECVAFLKTRKITKCPYDNCNGKIELLEGDIS